MLGTRGGTPAFCQAQRWVLPGAAAALLCVAAAVYLLRPTTDGAAPLREARADRVPQQQTTVEVAAQTLPPPPDAEATPLVADHRATAPCAGCLAAAEAQDVAETLVHTLGLNYGEARVSRPDDLPWYTRKRRWPPVPTEGLLDAPEYFSFGPKLPMPPCRGYDDPDCRGEREEWWIVWFHVGWRTPEEVERRIADDLPEVAVAWPPIKREEYVVVDAMNGRIVSYSRARDPSTNLSADQFEWAYWTARERARHYLGDDAVFPEEGLPFLTAYFDEGH